MWSGNFEEFSIVSLPFRVTVFREDGRSMIQSAIEHYRIAALHSIRQRFRMSAIQVAQPLLSTRKNIIYIDILAIDQRGSAARNLENPTCMIRCTNAHISGPKPERKPKRAQLLFARKSYQFGEPQSFPRLSPKLQWLLLGDVERT